MRPFTEGSASKWKKIRAIKNKKVSRCWLAVFWHSSLTQQVVALKEIRLQEEEGAPFTAIREASLLRDLRHANVVTLHDIVHTKTSLTFVFEYVVSLSNCWNIGLFF